MFCKIASLLVLFALSSIVESNLSKYHHQRNNNLHTLRNNLLQAKYGQRLVEVLSYVIAVKYME